MELADLQKKSPDEILQALARLEAKVQSRLPESKSEDQAGIPLIDWLVSQVLFVREAWNLIQSEVNSVEESLWLLEMLSLPECIRRPKRNWQKKQLIEQAVVNGNLRWRDILGRRKRRGNVDSYPRTPDFYFYRRQLTPYVSRLHCPRRWPNSWGFARIVELNLLIRPPIYQGGPLAPIQNGSSFSFFIEIFTNKAALILERPREYEKEKCIEQLIAWKNMLDGHLDHLKNQPESLPALKEGEARFVGLLGWGRALFSNVRDTGTFFQAIETVREQLQKDIEGLRKGGMTPSRRAAIMQKYFDVPLINLVVPVSVVPFDLEPGLLAMVLGAWLSEHGMLTVREKRSVRGFIERKMLSLISEIPVDQARALSLELLKRLGRFDRPLRGASIQKYLELFLRRGKFPNQRLSLCENMDQVEEGFEGEPPRISKQRIPKGDRKRLAARLDCHPKTVARHYIRYCGERRVRPCLGVWKTFVKNILRKG